MRGIMNETDKGGNALQETHEYQGVHSPGMAAREDDGALREEAGQAGAYKEVMEYNKWVLPAEGLAVYPRFDASLLNKVYIGNVAASKEEMHKLLSAYAPVTINILRSKECLFADFDNPHGAYLCMTELDGAAHGNRTLKAGRTSTFPPEIPEDLREVDSALVYISNIDAEADEDQLKEIFSKMGKVEELRLACDAPFVHKGYGYIRFERARDARRAIGYSNKLVFYSRSLKIGPTVVKTALPETIKDIPEEVFRIKRRIESYIYGRGRTVVLRNLIDVEDADEDFDQEIEREMRKYGSISGFRIVKSAEVAVYCMYENEGAAKHCCDILNGRFFGGRRIQVEISEEAVG
jgi:polyadenylate-binding protein